MTDPTPNAVVGSRRAAALLACWSREDRRGFDAVLTEINTEHELRDLLYGLCTAAQLLGERVFGAGTGWLDFIDTHTLDLATREASLPDGQDDDDPTMEGNPL